MQRSNKALRNYDLNILANTYIFINSPSDHTERGKCGQNVLNRMCFEEFVFVTTLKNYVSTGTHAWFIVRHWSSLMRVWEYHK